MIDTPTHRHLTTEARDMADKEQQPWGDISHLTESGSNFPFPWEARTYLPEGEDPRTTLSGEHEVWSADDQIVAEVGARQAADLMAAAPDLYEACKALIAALHPSASSADRGDAEEAGNEALAKAEGRDT